MIKNDPHGTCIEGQASSEGSASNALEDTATGAMDGTEESEASSEGAAFSAGEGATGNAYADIRESMSDTDGTVCAKLACDQCYQSNPKVRRQ